MKRTTADIWRRARTEEQITQRVDSILAAAARLFETTKYEAVTVQDIATEAGFTRSNVYRYFQTRETIFLELYKNDLSGWLTEFADALRTTSAPLSAEVLVDIWTDVLMRHERLLKLTPLLALSLENNTSGELFGAFKRFVLQIMGKTREILRPALPRLADDQFFALFFTHQALVAGGYPMCSYSEMQAIVLSAPDLSPLKLEFRSFYRSAMLSYLRGLTDHGD